MQLIHGMQEIKLNTAEQFYRWDWEHIQAQLFKLNFKSLSLNQYQQAGAFFINEGKNIVITFFVAKLVIDGQLTLGAMLSIQYMIGQLNSPIEQLISFTQNFQDAKIALERLNEIHQVADEEPMNKQFINELPEGRSIRFFNTSFSYAGAGNQAVLKQINLEIPEQKTTAIVGMSGSGKTTFCKQMVSLLGEERVLHISQDSYYRDLTHLPLEERAKINFDHPDIVEFPLLVSHLDELFFGKTILLFN
jgi:ATP-binding cassette subfamily B protein